VGKKIYHVTNSALDIKQSGFRPSENIPEVPRDDIRIQEVSSQNEEEYPIDRNRANFFYPSLQSIPFDYANLHVIVVDCTEIKKRAYVADRDIRDDIVFGNATNDKILSYLESIHKCPPERVHDYINEISGTSEVIIHGKIDPSHIIKIERGKFVQ